MKKVMSQCPKELVEIIRETYPGYWPLTREQICYFLFRKVEAGIRPRRASWSDGPVFSLRHVSPASFSIRSLDGPPLSEEIPKSECLSESDRTSESHLELWVDDAALTEFLRFHSRKFTGIPVYDAGRFQNIFAAREVKDRFARVQEDHEQTPGRALPR